MSAYHEFETYVRMWRVCDELNIENPILELYIQKFVTLRDYTITVTNLYNDIIVALGQKDYVTFLRLVQEWEHKTRENPLEQ